MFLHNIFTSTASPQHLLEPFTHPEDGDSTSLNNIRTFKDYNHASLNDGDTF